MWNQIFTIWFLTTLTKTTSASPIEEISHSYSKVKLNQPQKYIEYNPNLEKIEKGTDIGKPPPEEKNHFLKDLQNDFNSNGNINKTNLSNKILNTEENPKLNAKEHLSNEENRVISLKNSNNLPEKNNKVKDNPTNVTESNMEHKDPNIENKTPPNTSFDPQNEVISLKKPNNLALLPLNLNQYMNEDSEHKERIQRASGGGIKNGRVEKISNENEKDTNGVFGATDSKFLEKRSFGRYRSNVRRAVPVSIYEANSFYKPATYQISRPYYIPVYSFTGNQHPIFYAPQPYPASNPGVPKDNPVKPPYVGPSYLPPEEPTKRPPSRPSRPTKKPLGRPTGSTKMPLDNRFDFDDEDAPVWGELPTNMIPLRGDDSDEEEDSNAIGARPSLPSASSNRPQNNGKRPKPRPSFEMIRPAGSGSMAPLPTRPTIPTTSSTTLPPSSMVPPNAPNTCVWAIISCCSVGNPSTVPEACFEQRGCAGPFWGASPCDSEFARTAIEAAIKYYNNGGSP